MLLRKAEFHFGLSKNSKKWKKEEPKEPDSFKSMILTKDVKKEQCWAFIH